MPLALEQIRRMRGGAQAQLMRCADEAYYVVKFRNNPQGPRILANELLGTRLAARLGLPVPPAAVVEVRAELIAHTEELVIQLGRGRAPCEAGLQFGSRFPGPPAEVAVFDFLPEDQLREVSNLDAFCGVFVFDKWTCNTNGRQAIFYRGKGAARYEALMIDHGFCFNAGEWNFPDAPLRGLYARHCVYDSVRGMDAFEKWVARVESKMTEAVLDEAYREIPPQWYDFDTDGLERLLEQLLRRRKRVRELIFQSWKSSVEPFSNWK
jgi:hypothetical protein